MRAWRELAASELTPHQRMGGTRYYNPVHLLERCPLCRRNVKDRYTHLATVHGWKREGEVFKHNGEDA